MAQAFLKDNRKDRDGTLLALAPAFFLPPRLPGSTGALATCALGSLRYCRLRHPSGTQTMGRVINGRTRAGVFPFHGSLDLPPATVRKRYSG